MLAHRVSLWCHTNSDSVSPVLRAAHSGERSPRVAELALGGSRAPSVGRAMRSRTGSAGRLGLGEQGGDGAAEQDAVRDVRSVAALLVAADHTGHGAEPG